MNLSPPSRDGSFSTGPIPGESNSTSHLVNQASQQAKAELECAREALRRLEEAGSHLFAARLDRLAENVSQIRDLVMAILPDLEAAAELGAPLADLDTEGA